MAQNSIINPSTVPTPNQSSLGTYGIIPVSPYTGKADISVPIYSTEQRGVPLDIRLSYDTSGLRINQLPGWTGHNWTLLAGGAITRKINGNPDEVVKYASDYIEWVINLNDVNYLTNGAYENIYRLYDHYKDIFYYKNFWEICNCERCDAEMFKSQNCELVYVYQTFPNGPNNPPELVFVYGDYVLDDYPSEGFVCQYHQDLASIFAMREADVYINGLKEDAARKRKDTDITNSFMSSVANADVFYFNFLGFSGSFFYGNDGWKVQSEQNIDVWFDVDDQSNYITPLEELFWYKDYVEGSKYQLAVKQPEQIKGFTLVDENGIRYIFGGDKSAIEYTMPLTGKCNYNASDGWNAVSWMLKEIQDRYGNVLYKFNYSRSANIVQVNNSYNTVVKEYWMIDGDLRKKIETIPNYYSASLISPVYLDKISVRDGTDLIFSHSKVFNTPNVVCDIDSAYYKNYKFNVEKEESFFYNRASDVLYPNGVNVRKMLECAYPRLRCDVNGFDKYTGMHDSNNKWFKSFVQDSCRYYLDNMNLEKLNAIIISHRGSNVDETVYYFCYDFTNRMHLTSISKKGENPYVFEYRDFDKVPKDYLSKQFDFWGYYNGIDYDHSFDYSIDVPDSLNLSAFIKSRDMNESLHVPSFDCTMCGMLTKMIYPTGGYTTFDYELNTCSKYLDKNKNIQNTVKDVPCGGLRIKNVLTYDSDDELIGGKKFSYQKNGSSTGELYSFPFSFFEYGGKGDYADHYRESWVSSVAPMSNSFVPTIGYSNVVMTDLNGCKYEKTYSNFSSEKDDRYEQNYSENVTPYIEYSSRNYMRGKLLEEQVSDKDGKLLYKKTYEYASDKEFNNKYFVRTSIRGGTGCGSVYRLYYFHPHVTKIVEETKSGNEWIVQTTNKVTACDDVTVTPEGMKPHTANLWLPVRETKECGKDSVSQIMEYYYSDAKDNDIATKLMNQFCFPVKSVQNQYNGVLIGGETTQYGVFNDNVAPESVYAFKSNPDVKQLKGQILSYYPDFSVKEMNDGNGINHKFYWNKDEQLLASLANAKSDLVNVDAGIDRIKMSNMDEIFTSKDIDANLYSYDKKGRLITTFGANGIKMDYAYSENDRLQSVKKNDKWLMDYRYHFRPSKYKANIENEFDYFTETRIPGKTPSGKLKYEIRFGAKNVEFKMRLITGGGRKTVWTYKVRDYSKLKGEFRSPGLPSRGDYVLEIYEDGKYVGEAWTRFSK